MADHQVREGHGLQGQESRCRSYANEKGYEVAAVFRDEGVSGGVIEREGMDQLLAYLDTLETDGECVVIIDDIKRLARDLIGHFSLRKTIQAHGARLESPSHEFGESPEEIFVESIMAATAELERNQNKKQVRNRMKARLEAGYWLFYPPAGYTFTTVPGHGKLLVPKEPEASLIREVYEGFALGRFLSLAEVARYLKSHGFTARLGGVAGMTYIEQVKRLITRDLYAEVIFYPPRNVSPRRGQHQPLIDGVTFSRVQERLKESANRSRRENLQQDFPLRSFLVCASCLKPFTSSWAKGRNKEFPYYRCNCQTCPKYNKSSRAEIVHEAFNRLLQTLNPRESILKVIEQALLAEWDRRQMDVEIVHQERQKKLDSIDGENRRPYIQSARLALILNVSNWVRGWSLYSVVLPVWGKLP